MLRPGSLRLPGTTPLFAGLAGLAGACLHFAGALKSTPALATLPFDVTLLALLALLGLLPLLVLCLLLLITQ